MKVFIDKPKSAFSNIHTTEFLKDIDIRVFFFDKEYALAGFHQDIQKELRLDYLEKEGIGYAKNLLSGQAVFVDEDTIGVEFRTDKEVFLKSIVDILKYFGIESYIESTSIKIGQKRLSFIHADLDKNIFQIFLPFDINIEKTLKSIHMPVEKLTSKGIKSADDRLISIKKALNKDLSKKEFIQAFLQSILRYFENAEFLDFDIKDEDNMFCTKEFIFKDSKDVKDYIYGLYRCKGATFRVYIKEEKGILKDIFINGDYILSPIDYIKNLEKFLINKPVDSIKDEIDMYLSQNPFDGIDVKPKDIKEAIMFAVRKLQGEVLGFSKEKLNNIIASIGGELIENLQKAKVMLLPYCAKPRWCDYRHLDDCGECGGCTVGDAYRLAYQKGMIPMTITSFELLRDTLLWCADNGYTYIGHCCYEFYEKRYEAFEKASSFGANGVLFDIVGTTCYNLGVEEEEKAYHGEFSVELDLIKEDLVKSMDVKKDEFVGLDKSRQSFDFSSAFLDFRPSYYKKPKAVPTPEEDRTRTSMQREVFQGEATIKDSVVSYKEALKELANLIKSSKNPSVVIGPLLFWDFGEKELQEKAHLTRALIEKMKNVNVKILPDYRPKLKNYDPSVEMDPPNPQDAINHTKNDLTILIGTHCYRTDFVIRLLKKHTPTTVVALCGLYGHPEADLSTSFTDAEKLEYLVNML